MKTDIKELREKLVVLADVFINNAVTQREADPGKSYQWYVSSEICRKAAQELERMEPVKMELDGGGHFWFMTCGECGVVVADDSKFCCNCGHPFISEG